MTICLGTGQVRKFNQTHWQKHWKFKAFAILLFAIGTTFISSVAVASDIELYEQTGMVDPDWEEVKQDFTLGEINTSGYSGSIIELNKNIVGVSPITDKPIERPIDNALRIHTVGNANVGPSAFSKWTRWYQEDGNTQIFRLFKGEESMLNQSQRAARVEALSPTKQFSYDSNKPTWHEFLATYTLATPSPNKIFQIFNSKTGWTLSVKAIDGKVFVERRGYNGRVFIANGTPMIGTPFSLRVRDNGFNYEVYVNGKFIIQGKRTRNSGKSGFRWGIYTGDNNEVTDDQMLFVTGAKVLRGGRPNIVFFLVDDMDKNEVSSYEGVKGLTPTLDSLAESGVKFQEAYVSSTVCTPSRYTCLTGRHPSRSQYKPYLDNYPADEAGTPSFKVGLESDGYNAATILQDNRYYTGYVGKYHLGLYNGQKDLVDEFYDKEKEVNQTYEQKKQQGDLIANNYLKNKATKVFKQIENKTRRHIKKMGFEYVKNVYHGNVAKPFDAHNLEWTLQAALEFIDKSQNTNIGDDRPFYLHFCTTLMHGPSGSWAESMSEEKSHYTGRGWINNPISIPGMANREAIKQSVLDRGLNKDYFGYAWLDQGVRAVVNRLEKHGLLDNTIFVFMADHGSANKASLYSKDGTNIPMIISYPKVTTTKSMGSECHNLVQNIDLVPTFFDWADIQKPENYVMDGLSIARYFKNPDQSNDIRNRLYFELGSGRAVLWKNFKYIVNRYSDDRLQNLAENAYENRTLIDMINDYSYLGNHDGVSKRGMMYNSALLSDAILFDVGSKGNRKKNAEARKPKVRCNRGDILRMPLSATTENNIIQLHDYLEAFLTDLNSESGQTRPYGEFQTTEEGPSGSYNLWDNTRTSDKIYDNRRKLINLIDDLE